MHARLKAADPAGLLARGWSITRTADGSVVRSVNDVDSGDTIITALTDGAIISNVTLTDPIPPSAEPPGDADA
jgi:exodeoxyribonuclease VII large subunit